MKLFGFAAVLTGIVLVTLNARRRRLRLVASKLSEIDRRYGIEDFVDGLD